MSEQDKRAEEVLNPCWCGATARQKRNGIVVCSLISRHGYAYDAEEWNRRPSAAALAQARREGKRESYVKGYHEGLRDALLELEKIAPEIRTRLLGEEAARLLAKEGS